MRAKGKPRYLAYASWPLFDDWARLGYVFWPANSNSIHDEFGCTFAWICDCQCPTLRK